MMNGSVKNAARALLFLLKKEDRRSGKVLHVHFCFRRGLNRPACMVFDYPETPDGHHACLPKSPALIFPPFPLSSTFAALSSQSVVPALCSTLTPAGKLFGRIRPAF
jgi:hypothetical protein